MFANEIDIIEDNVLLALLGIDQTDRLLRATSKHLKSNGVVKTIEAIENQAKKIN